jgi:LPS-assembly lipoprotein
MSSSDRRTLLVGLGALALSGCGFRPAFGPGGVATDLRGQVEIDPPDSLNEFDLVARLEERLGRVEAPAYRLSYRLTTRSEGLALSGARETTRYSLLGEVAFRLRDVETGAVVDSGTVMTFTSYSATGTTLATRTAERDAYQRLMVILADRLVARLVATAGDRAQ